MIFLISVLCFLDVILLTGLLFNWDQTLPSYFNQGKINQKNDLPIPLVYEDMIVDDAVVEAKNNFPEIKDKNSDWHKYQVWIAAEQFYHNREIYEQYINDKIPSDSVYKEAFLTGIKRMTELINASRRGTDKFNRDWGWIDSVASKKLGFQSDSVAVLIVRKTDKNKKKLYHLSGIALRVEKKYFFFPACTLERKPKDGVLITANKDCYGYWLPSLVNDDNQFLPLTYWGKNKKTENALN